MSKGNGKVKGKFTELKEQLRDAEARADRAEARAAATAKFVDDRKMYLEDVDSGALQVMMQAGNLQELLDQVKRSCAVVAQHAQATSTHARQVNKELSVPNIDDATAARLVATIDELTGDRDQLVVELATAGTEIAGLKTDVRKQKELLPGWLLKNVRRLVRDGDGSFRSLTDKREALSSGDRDALLYLARQVLRRAHDQDVLFRGQTQGNGTPASVLDSERAPTGIQELDAVLGTEPEAEPHPFDKLDFSLGIETEPEPELESATA